MELNMEYQKEKHDMNVNKWSFRYISKGRLCEKMQIKMVGGNAIQRTVPDVDLKIIAVTSYVLFWGVYYFVGPIYVS